MNLTKLAEDIDTQIKHRVSQIDVADTGTVVKVNGSKCTVSVVLHGTEEKHQIDNIPLMVPSAQGYSTGFYVLPRIGDQVVILYLEPRKSAPIVLGSYFKTIDNNSFQTNANIWELKHSSGSYIRFTAAGDIVINCAPGRAIYHTRS